MTKHDQLYSFLLAFGGSRETAPDFGLMGKIRDKSVTAEELRSVLAFLSAEPRLPEALGSLDRMRRLHYVANVMRGHEPRYRGGATSERRLLLSDCATEIDRTIGKPDW